MMTKGFLKNEIAFGIEVTGNHGAHHPIATHPVKKKISKKIASNIRLAGTQPDQMPKAAPQAASLRARASCTTEKSKYENVIMGRTHCL